LRGLAWAGEKARIVELDAGMQRLDDLGDGVGDEAVVGVAVAAFGSPSEDDLRVELVD